MERPPVQLTLWLLKRRPPPYRNDSSSYSRVGFFRARAALFLNIFMTSAGLNSVSLCLRRSTITTTGASSFFSCSSMGTSSRGGFYHGTGFNDEHFIFNPSPGQPAFHLRKRSQPL